MLIHRLPQRMPSLLISTSSRNTSLTRGRKSLGTPEVRAMISQSTKNVARLMTPMIQRCLRV